MSTAEPITAAAEQTPSGSRVDNFLSGLEAWLGKLSDGLNPIVVKETRQALKSKQFSITFLLTLAFSWGWSMLGMALLGPSIYYAASGKFMFVGYFLILAFSLLVIVPFGAFRSLAAEREDGTYELLSITALKPRQIVTGKLASAIVQIIVFTSAVSPCIAFTYLLQGIDVPSLATMLVVLVLSSVLLSVICLTVATASTERHWQIILTVVVVVALMMTFSGLSSLLVNLLLEEPIPYFSTEFNITAAALLTIFAGYFWLLLCVASAQLTFASDNRATWIRIVLFLHQVVFTGWMGYGLLASEVIFVVVPFLIITVLHWGVFGMFFNVENPQLSNRVRRQLPQHIVTRSLFSWFLPGSGLGYFFALVNFAGACLLTLLAIIFHDQLEVSLSFMGGPGANMVENFHLQCLVLFSYLAIYLGVGRLCIMFLRKYFWVHVIPGVLLQLCILCLGTFGPMAFHFLQPDISDRYHIIELPNPFYTFFALLEGQIAVEYLDFVYYGLPVFAMLVIMANLPSVASELIKAKIAKPKRVVEEDAELQIKAAALAQPDRPERNSPWDDDPAVAVGNE